MAEMRALLYVRLSDWRGEEDPSMSPEGQEQACRDYCAAMGWSVVDVVTDLDVSGSDKGLRLDRPGIKELASRFRDADVIVFKRLDRLARNVVDFRAFMESAQNADVALVSVEERLDLTTSMGRFVATILAAFGEMEAAMIGDRVKDGRANQRKARRYGGGFVPWGYKSAPAPDGPGRVLVINEEEAAITRECAERIIRGESLYGIGQDLIARGVPGRKSGRWDASKVKRIVTNPSAIGIMLHGKVPVRDELGLPIKAWPAAIDPDLQAEAIAALAKRKMPERGIGPKASRLLSGMIPCPGCGRPLSVNSTRGLGRYSCHSRARGLECPKGVSVTVELADAEVERRLLLKVGAWRRLIEVIHQQAPDKDALREVEDALADVGKAFQNPNADVTALVGRRNALLAHRDTLTRTEAVTETMEAPMTVAEEWAAGSLVDRRKILMEYVEEVNVRPNNGRRRFSPDRIIMRWHPWVKDLDFEQVRVIRGAFIGGDDETMREVLAQT